MKYSTNHVRRVGVAGGDVAMVNLPQAIKPKFKTSIKRISSFVNKRLSRNLAAQKNRFKEKWTDLFLCL